MKEVKIVELKNCLKGLSSKDKKKLCLDLKVKKVEDILEHIGDVQALYLRMLSDEQIDGLKRIIKEKMVDEKEAKSLYKALLFENENYYVIPSNVVEKFNNMINSDELFIRMKNIIYYYLFVNGIIEISKLIDLCKETGIVVTEDDIEVVIKETGIIRKKDMLYLNSLAESFGNNKEMQKIKREEEYKVFSIGEITQNIDLIMEDNYSEKIYNIISGKEDDEDMKDLSDFIFYFVCSGFEYKESIRKNLKKFNAKLSDEKMASLEELLKKIENTMPLWSLNGYKNSEVDDDEEYEKEPLNYMTDDEKLEMYLYAYIGINGIIHISKFIQILNKYHSLNITEKELKKYIKTLDNVYIIDDYLCRDSLDKENLLFMESIKKREEYKIIDNFFKFTIEDENYENDFMDICSKYEFDDDITSNIRFVINVGMLNEDMLSIILNENNIHMSLKKQREFMNELKKVIKNLRLWNLNGFRQSEIRNVIENKTKVGRNEMCPCGSGKKYKQCCGK